MYALKLSDLSADPVSHIGKEREQMKTAVLIFAVLVGAIIVSGCTISSTPVVELKQFPIENLDGVIARSAVEFDIEVSSDGNGSLRIRADAPMSVRLFEVTDIDIEDARLIYQARVRSEDIRGQVYLEMLCHFSGAGEFFSRNIQTPISGTTEWTTEETPFFLQKGQKPDYIKLNLVIDGVGTVWIDDVRLLVGPLG